MTTKSPFKVVQAMIKLQAEQNVEARLACSFETFTLPEADYDEGIEALTQMFDKMYASSPTLTESFDNDLYKFIFESDDSQPDELSESVSFYNNVVCHLDSYDSLNMLKHHLYEYGRFNSADLDLLIHFTWLR